MHRQLQTDLTFFAKNLGKLLNVSNKTNHVRVALNQHQGCVRIPVEKLDIMQTLVGFPQHVTPFINKYIIICSDTIIFIS